MRNYTDSNHTQSHARPRPPSEFHEVLSGLASFPWISRPEVSLLSLNLQPEYSYKNPQFCVSLQNILTKLICPSPLPTFFNKSVGCSSRGPGSNSQHPYGDLQLSES